MLNDSGERKKEKTNDTTQKPVTAVLKNLGTPLLFYLLLREGFR